MTVFVEGNLQLTVYGAKAAWRFDGDDHKLTHCMKAVDFVIELEDSYQFIEFKDPQYPGAPPKEVDDYIGEFKAGRLDKQFQYKYRDSYLYELAFERAEKPIDYLMLIAIDTLTGALLRHRKREMERKLPLWGPGKQQLPRPFIRGCGVFNIPLWNRRFPNYQIVRLPPQPSVPEI